MLKKIRKFRENKLISKVPNVKFPKYKMDGLEEIEELNKEYSLEEMMNLRQEADAKKHVGAYIPFEFQTVKEFFDKSTKENADKTFILEKFVRKAPFEEITYGQFRKDVINLGTGLTKAFKLKGEKLIVIGETTYQWYVSYTAMLCGAGIAVPVDNALPDHELESIIKRADAAAVIYSPRKRDQIKKVANKCPGVKYFMEMNSDNGIDGRFVGLNFVMEEGKVITDCGDESFMNIEIDPKEFALLLFTSGTTSQSKGVMLNNQNLAYNVNAVSAYVRIFEDDRLFSVLPLHHTYESTIGFLVPLANGASIVVCQGLKHIVNDMKETHPTAMLAVPLLIETLYKRINQTIEKSGKASLVKSMIRVTKALNNFGVDVKRKVFKDIHESLGGRMRIVVSAAAPIDPTVGHWLEDIGIMFLQGYGLTETAPISAMTPDYDRSIGSVGKPVICNKIMIKEPNENGEGEVLISGKTVMMGYYENEEETAKVMEGEWFNSGDIGYMDEKGFLYLTGRSKNVIVTQNGKNIYPEEIETLLSQVEEIKESMVYGKEVEGEKELTITVRLIPDYEKIQEDSEEELTEEQMNKIIWEKIRGVNKHLSNYKAIKSMEIKRDEFVKTTTMKIKRYAELKKDAERTEENQIFVYK